MLQSTLSLATYFIDTANQNAKKSHWMRRRVPYLTAFVENVSDQPFV